MLQETMIERVRALCQADTRVVAAMMYGSFCFGEGDRYSDIEFVLFFEDSTYAGLDRRAWLSQIAPVALLFVNEFGVTTAIFENLVRGEFHFHAASEIEIAGGFQANGVWFPSLDSTLICDKTGMLTPYLEPLIGGPPDRTAPENLQFVVNCFFNWLVFGLNVLRRGELARALELLSAVQRNLLWMARALEGSTEHWPIPARLLERDLSANAVARYRACTAALDGPSLRRAYGECWRWAAEMLPELAARFGVTTPQSLFAPLDAVIAEISWAPRSGEK